MLGKPVPDFSLASTGRSSSHGPFRLPAHPARSSFLHPYQETRFAFEPLSEKVRGIARASFVIAAGGVLARERRGVKVPGHAQEVLNFAKAL